MASVRFHIFLQFIKLLEKMLITKLKKVYPLIAVKTSGKLTKFELLTRLNGL